MIVRCIYRNMNQDRALEKLIPDLWPIGVDSIPKAADKFDLEFQDYHGPLVDLDTGEIELRYNSLAMVLIGGRGSIIKYLKSQECARVAFKIPRWTGAKLGIVTGRKKDLFSKNKTAVAICRSDWRTDTNFIWQVDRFVDQGVGPIDPTGQTVTALQLGNILDRIFQRTPTVKTQQLLGTLNQINNAW